MAPKQQRITVEKAGSRRGGPPKGYVANVYESLTSPENASVVKSVAIFGVCLSHLDSRSGRIYDWGHYAQRDDCRAGTDEDLEGRKNQTAQF